MDGFKGEETPQLWVQERPCELLRGEWILRGTAERPAGGQMQRDEDSLDGEEEQGGESGRLSDCTLEIQATVLWAEGKKLHV